MKVFRAKVVKARLTVSDYESENMARYLRELEGELVNLAISKFNPKKARYVESDPWRRYYFKFVLGPIKEYTGASVEDIHTEMKSRYAFTVDEFGIKHLESVFSKHSKMEMPDKKRFIHDVRAWANDFLGVITPEFESRRQI